MDVRVPRPHARRRLRGLTAVGIRGFTDDPLISGGESLIFYISFTIAIVGIVYVMLNSTLMETKVTSDGITGQTWRPRNPTIIRLEQHHRHPYRQPQHRTTRRPRQPFAPSTRRAWTMYGVRTGIEIEVSR